MSLDVGNKYSVQGGAQLSNKVMVSWVKQRNFIEAILLTKVTENVDSLGVVVADIEISSQMDRGVWMGITKFLQGSTEIRKFINK